MRLPPDTLILCGLTLVLVAIVLVILRQQAATKRELKAVRQELNAFGPIRDVEGEVAARREAVEREIEAARGAANEAWLNAEREIRQQREDLDRATAVAREELSLARRQASTEVDAAKAQLIALQVDLTRTEELVRSYTLELDLQEMGYYQPKFDFDSALEYAEALDLLREAQKELIRQKRALENITGDASPESRDIGKLAIDAFNGDATAITSAVSYRNFERSKQKLQIEFTKVNRLLESTGIRLSQSYLELKLKEMALAYDFREAEEKAKQEQAELREQIKEEEDAREEAEEGRRKAIEEEERYQAALDAARAEVESKSADERRVYEEKVRALEARLEEAHAARERATSMAQITRKGHVYILSNIGSFGETVFKIGMTRRTEPGDRVRELGDASVPFRFDVHALVRTDDAPALENALHRYFGEKRMNRVNLRKEFFRATIDEIAEACEKLGLQIQLTKLAEAREYRQSLELEEQLRSGAETAVA
jgi:hypothetical protein